MVVKDKNQGTREKSKQRTHHMPQARLAPLPRPRALAVPADRVWITAPRAWALVAGREEGGGGAARVR